MAAREYLEHQTYDHDTTITGAFHEGVTVRRGIVVKITGFLEGPVHIEEGGQLDLTGSYTPSRGTLAGSVLLKGVLIGDPSGLKMPGGILALMAPAVIENGSETLLLTVEGTIVQPGTDDLEIGEPAGAWTYHPKVGDYTFHSQKELDQLILPEQTVPNNEGTKAV